MILILFCPSTVIEFFLKDVFPINFLRNVAWNFSRTPYVFLVDVDFTPLSGSDETQMHLGLQEAVTDNLIPLENTGKKASHTISKVL